MDHETPISRMEIPKKCLSCQHTKLCRFTISSSAEISRRGCFSNDHVIITVFLAVGDLKTLRTTVDGSEIRRSPPGMGLKPCKLWNIYHINWLAGIADHISAGFSWNAGPFSEDSRKRDTDNHFLSPWPLFWAEFRSCNSKFHSCTPKCKGFLVSQHQTSIQSDTDFHGFGRIMEILS